MNKLIVYTSTLHDKIGFPVCSINGDLEFITNTYKQSIENADVSDDLKNLLRNGTIRLHSVTVAFIDDNDVNFNVARTEKLSAFFHVDEIEYPFDIKSFSKRYKLAVKLVNKIVGKLECECKNIYDLKKKESEEHAKEENC